MMQITRAADYAVRVVIYVAANGGERCVPTAEISECQDIPTAYVSKVLQALGKAGIIATFPGRGGGAKLVDPAEKISILNVVEAIDGPITLNRCVVRKGMCSRDSFCSAHPFWAATRKKLVGILGQAKMSEFVEPGKPARKKSKKTKG